jgi:hypothetical protein
VSRITGVSHRYPAKKCNCNGREKKIVILQVHGPPWILFADPRLKTLSGLIEFPGDFPRTEAMQ